MRLLHYSNRNVAEILLYHNHFVVHTVQLEIISIISKYSTSAIETYNNNNNDITLSRFSVKITTFPRQDVIKIINQCNLIINKTIINYFRSAKTAIGVNLK